MATYTDLNPEDMTDMARRGVFQHGDRVVISNRPGEAVGNPRTVYVWDANKMNQSTGVRGDFTQQQFEQTDWDSGGTVSLSDIFSPEDYLPGGSQYIDVNEVFQIGNSLYRRNAQGGLELVNQPSVPTYGVNQVIRGNIDSTEGYADALEASAPLGMRGPLDTNALRVIGGNTDDYTPVPFGTSNVGTVTGGGSTRLSPPTGTTSVGSYEPQTLADMIRQSESESRGGRARTYGQVADIDPTTMALSPVARNVVAQGFNPLSASWVLANAPYSAGGADPGWVGSFESFISPQSRVAYDPSRGGYYQRTESEMTPGPWGRWHDPMTRADYEARLGALNLPAGGDLTTLPMDVQNYLANLTFDEASNIMYGATAAGAGPLLRPTAESAIERGTARYRRGDPSRGAGQMLSDWYLGGMSRNPFADYIYNPPAIPTTGVQASPAFTQAQAQAQAIPQTQASVQQRPQWGTAYF